MDDSQDHRPCMRGEASFYLGGISAIIETAVGSTMPMANLENGCAMFWEGWAMYPTGRSVMRSCTKLPESQNLALTVLYVQ